MLNTIIRFSVRNKLIVGLFTLALIVWGTIDLKNLPIDALPDITSNQVQIITVSPSLAAPEVERLITFPLEQVNANIPGLKEMRSISRFGLSVVTVVFNDNTDIYWARQQVGERLNLVREQIPSDAGNPELAPTTTGIGEIYQYVLRPQKGYEGKYDLAELRSMQDWIVRRQLLGTPGVADVSSFGGYLKQYEIAVQPDHLKSMNVTIADVFTALEKNNQNSGGAYIEKGPAALFIRTEGLATTTAELEKIFVKHTSSGIPVYMKDVAEVRIGHAIRYGAMTYKDQGEVAGAVVLMLKDANASQVIEDVKKRIEQIKKTLPEGIVLETFYDRTKMVDNAIGTVKTNLLEGALIVIFVLVLFLGNLRAGLIVASVIPLSMLFAVILMNLFGVSGNLMSLGALDFGLIVDGAVIIVEAVLHRLGHNKQFAGLTRITQARLNEEVSSSAGKMMNAAVFGQIIILIVYLPILTLTGIEGKMFRPMAQTVSFALIGAFLLSLTYVPMMSSLCLNKKLSHKDTWADKMMNVLQGWYQPLLKKALTFPKMVVAFAILLLAVAVFIMSRLGGEFIPKLEEGDFAVDARLLAGSSLTETIKESQKAVAILQSRFPEVEKIVTRIGASEIPTDPMPLEMTDIMITLKPKKEWTSATSFDELANKMSKALEVVPGITHGFQYPVQMRFNELISGARQDIVCKIFGEDLDSLSAYANYMGNIVSTVEGAHDIYIESVTGLPQIVIKYNREAMAHYQLNISDVNRMVRTAFAGEAAGIIYENERRYDLVVRLEDEGRKDLSDVQQLLIPTPAGLQVPLYQVASVDIKEGPNQIQRENAQRRIIVGFNVRGRDIESVVDELSRKADNQLKLPAGYYIKYGGQFENLVEATQRLSIAVPVALLLILVMLYFAFGSLKYGLLIFSAIPLSAIGGILALWARDMPFSISAGVGFIALFGVAVLNGIVLITEFNRLKQTGIQNIQQIIMEGTRIRLRPVLMTASVASLGFLPMALSQGAGAEVQRPLATVVIGGLITATLLTLLVLPVLYSWFEKGGMKKIKIKPAATVVLFLLLCGSVQSQQRLTLDEMLKMGSAQNLHLQSLKKEAGYWEQLQSGVFDPGKTQAGGEYGGINGIQKDTRFFVSQDFNLPVVYRRQQQLYKSRQTAQEQLVNWKQAELQREIKLVFYALIDGQERKQLLQRLDSVYSRFQQSADLRLKAGESNVLEKTTADAQLQQLQLQQQQLNADILLLQQQLQWLLRTDALLLPAYTSLKMESTILADSASVTAHPQIQYSQLQEKIATAQTGVEKAKLSPDFAVGYSNQSIIGYHSADGVHQKYYSGSNRFHIASLTVGIPLFNGAAKARIKAGRIQEEVAGINTKATEQFIKHNLQQLTTTYQKEQNNLQYYENTGLQQAELIIQTAKLSFENGEISYLEWTTLMNNAVSIRLNYIDAVHQYNQTLIELEYLTGK
ncbi:CusA/CzcA family heavy metal efflux RND transporter [Agriterribacter sp.]|mgnify:FL=1|uniref:CusA/CzcA family heavy metal efflux RND transporter n=3 Tax=Agriterribacter sp. TaxID=2821509 RepID=UPI002C123AD5|nr:CusA/CzcA family heavy metal efflux RND transporter [Agriterribacter sp.]HRO47177.1 CusA/CzcA family heavy metal efflux RND transporter [Agriterribacter sp.]